MFNKVLFSDKLSKENKDAETNIANALKEISTLKIEELIYELKDKYTIVIVTHNMQQAARVSDYTAFMYMGDLIEFDATNKMFTNPSAQQTEDYITGRFG